jgi:hypothetical protein
MKILIAGDLFISDRFRGRDLCDHTIDALFAAADFRVVNLEAPIAEDVDGQRILKTGSHLAAAGAAVLPFLMRLGIDLATLANNHIMDFGRPGLAETLESLRNAGIGAVGAGLDLPEAAQPFVFERDGLRVAVLNFGENEWASASPGRAGANPSDVVENVKHIREARRACDIVIVVIHGGLEDFRFPTPRMVKEYRFYVDNGASVIVGHHPHYVGGMEIHKGRPIFYSLGNFLFTQPSESELWYTGLVLGLEYRPGEAPAWTLTPVAQSKEDFSLRVLEGEAGAAVVRDVEGSSRTIADETLLEREWAAFLECYGRYYANFFSPLSIIRSDRIRAGLEKLGLDRLFVTKSHYAKVLNTIRCESHAEAAKAVLDRLLRYGRTK